MRIYKLLGSDDTENLKLRISFLTKELESAEKKEIHINEIRQANMNYALIIFAGLFTFGLGLLTGLLLVTSSLSLFLLMTAFCFMDRRYHQYIHGWRKTQKIIENKISVLINNPKRDIEFPRYYIEGEEEAENFSMQPIIYYLLILGGLIHFIYSGITYLNL